MDTTDVIEQLSRALSAPVRLIGSATGRALRAVTGTSAPLGVDVPLGIGSLALRIAGRTRLELDRREWAILDAAVLLLTREYDDEAIGHRERVCGRLLDPRPSVRGDALWELRSRRWIGAPGDALRVWVMIVEDAGIVAQVALGRHVAAALPARTEFVTATGDVVVLVSATTVDVDETVTRIEAEALAQGSELRAVATADCSSDQDDLQASAQQAIDAARLRAVMPQALAARAEDLGGWMLVQSVPSSERLLKLVSPAAHELLRGDEVQRQTIEAYLDEAGRAPDTCARLHIHRTTLYYRLEHMPDAVRAALADGLQRSTLHLALKTARLWEQDTRSSAATPAMPSSATAPSSDAPSSETTRERLLA